MANIIDKSFSGVVKCTVHKRDGFSFTVQTGVVRVDTYLENDIAEIVEVDSDQYRNAGTAVLGAVVGGALTGGIGLLVGAAFGGRKKDQGTYFIKTTKGDHIAIEVKGKIASRLALLVNQHEMKALASQK